MSSSRTVHAKRNLMAGIINKAITLLLPFISRSFIINYLGAEFLGLNSVFTSVLQMLNLAELGFSSAVVFSMYKPIAQGANEEVCALLKFYKNVYRIVGGVITVLGISIIPFLKHIVKDEIPEGYSVYLLYILFLVNTALSFFLFAYKRSLLEASQRNDIVTGINTGIIVVQNVIQILSLIFYRDFYLYLVVMICCTIINNLVVAFVTRKFYPQYICRGEISDEIKNSLKYKIGGLMISRICVTTRNSLDSIIISAFIGLIPVAIYGNYYYIMSGIHAILGVITTSVAASVGNSIAVETTEKNYMDMMKFTFIYAWISGVCVNCLLNLYQPFMKIWMGEEMMFPMSVVASMCIYFYALTMGDIRSMYMTGAGLWWEGRYRSIAETIMNLALNIVLGKLMGVIGIVIATILSILIINFGYGSHIVFKYYFKNNKAFLYYKQQICFAVLVMASCLLSSWLCQLVGDRGVYSLGINLFISIVISNLCFACLGPKFEVYKSAKVFVQALIKRR